MIKTIKQNDQQWEVINTRTGKTALITKFADCFMGDVTYYFRVDVKGITKGTLINNYQTARGIAYKYVK